MANVLFLIGDAGIAQNDNHVRLPAAFRKLGHEVTTVDHTSVSLHGNELLIGECSADRYELLWLLGFGPRESFLDRMQLLKRIDQRRFVNPVDAYTYLHSKLNFTEYMPETHAAGSLEPLIQQLDDATRWVVKPSATSFGRDVAIIGNDDRGRERIRRVIEKYGFAVVQRYVDSVDHGEVRFLVAAGKPIGCYKRLPAPDHRANLAAGGRPVVHTATPREAELANTIGSKLLECGIRFAAVDIAGPYLIEVNVVNPGGLATLQKLTGDDLVPLTVRTIVESMDMIASRG